MACLRLKKDMDLDQLTNLGFQKDYYDNYIYSCPDKFPDNSIEIDTDRCGLVNIYIDGWCVNQQIFMKFYDLIKMGLIEKSPQD